MRVFIATFCWLLWFGIASGQDKFPDPNDFIYAPRGTEHVLIRTILHEYKIYARECYNDSTLVITGGGPEIHTTVMIDSLGRKILDLSGVHFQNAVYIITKKWTHKEPTLPGFMAWIEKEYERKKN